MAIDFMNHVLLVSLYLSSLLALLEDIIDSVVGGALYKMSNLNIIFLQNEHTECTTQAFPLPQSLLIRVVL